MTADIIWHQPKWSTKKKLHWPWRVGGGKKEVYKLRMAFKYVSVPQEPVAIKRDTHRTVSVLTQWSSPSMQHHRGEWQYLVSQLCLLFAWQITDTVPGSRTETWNYLERDCLCSTLKILELCKQRFKQRGGRPKPPLGDSDKHSCAICPRQF